VRSGKTEALRRREADRRELGAPGLVGGIPVVRHRRRMVPAAGAAPPDAASPGGAARITPATMVTSPLGQRAGPVELVRDQEHRATVGGRGPEEPVEHIAAGGRRGRHGARSSSRSRGWRATTTAQGGAAAAGRRRAARRRRPPSGSAPAARERHRRRPAARRRPGTPEPDVLPHRQVVVGAWGVAEQGQVGARHRLSVGGQGP